MKKEEKLNFHVKCIGEPCPEAVRLFNQQFDIYFREYIEKNIDKLRKEDIFLSKQITVRGKQYNLTYEDGQPVLTTFNDRAKIWVKLRFAPEGTDTSEIKENIVDLVAKLFSESVA